MNQFSLFDDFGSLFKEEDLQDYLKPEEKITSIQRSLSDILSKKRKEKGLTDILDISYSLKDKWSNKKSLEHITKRIGTRIFTPIISEFKDLNTLQQEIQKIFDGFCEVLIEDICDLPYESELLFWCMEERKKLGDYDQNLTSSYLPCRVTVKDSSGAIHFLSCGNSRIGNSYHQTMRALRGRPYHLLCDLAQMLGELYLFKSIKSYLESATNLSNVNYRTLNSFVFRCNHSRCSFKDKTPLKLYLPDDLGLPHVKQELKDLGFFAYFTSLDDYKALVKDYQVSREFFRAWNMDYRLGISILKDGANAITLNNIYAHDCESLGEKLKDNPEYNIYIHVSSKLGSSTLLDIFALMIEEDLSIQEEANFEHKQKTDYATSYETKKHIPDKVISKMKSSLLNRYFGYVEFDEMVDLKKINQIEKEFDAFGIMFNLPKEKDHSIRFRRLGKHKAGGLYWPVPKALCVDLNCPGAFIHEYMHLLDFVNGKLSSKRNFTPVKERYKEVVKKRVSALPKNHKFLKQWSSKSKYSSSYYFQDTEIFARCGELYIKTILGIDNSLIDGSEDYIYPKDDQILLNLIDNYYSGLLIQDSSKQAV